MKHSILATTSKNPAKLLKDEIQATLREIAILRDGGCVFRYTREMGLCGGYRKDGKLILQYDHLNSRANAISYADSRLGVCACKRHHIFYKRQYPAQYEKHALEIIGKERAELLEKVRADKKPYKVNWVLELAALRQELNKLKQDTL